MLQLLITIDYLQSRGITCGCLSSRNVLLDDQGVRGQKGAHLIVIIHQNVKLADYGLHMLTAGGSQSRMPLQPSLSFVAPEVLSLGLSRQSGFQSKVRKMLKYVITPIVFSAVGRLAFWSILVGNIRSTASASIFGSQ